MADLLQADTLAKYARAVMMTELGSRREIDPALTLPDIYPFTPDQVGAMYLYRNGIEGVWFRLKDVRMFDLQAQPVSTEALYA